MKKICKKIHVVKRTNAPNQSHCMLWTAPKCHEYTLHCIVAKQQTATEMRMQTLVSLYIPVVTER